MSPTKVLWLSAVIMTSGIAINNPQVCSFALFAAILATIAETVLYLTRGVK